MACYAAFNIDSNILRGNCTLMLICKFIFPVIIYLSCKHFKELLCIFQGNANGRVLIQFRDAIIKI